MTPEHVLGNEVAHSGSPAEMYLIAALDALQVAAEEEGDPIVLDPAELPIRKKVFLEQQEDGTLEVSLVNADGSELEEEAPPEE